MSRWVDGSMSRRLTKSTNGSVELSISRLSTKHHCLTPSKHLTSDSDLRLAEKDSPSPASSAKSSQRPSKDPVSSDSEEWGQWAIPHSPHTDNISVTDSSSLHAHEWTMHPWSARGVGGGGQSCASEWTRRASQTMSPLLHHHRTVGLHNKE